MEHYRCPNINSDNNGEVCKVKYTELDTNNKKQIHFDSRSKATIKGQYRKVCTSKCLNLRC